MKRKRTQHSTPIPTTLDLGPLPTDPETIWFCLTCETTVTPKFDTELELAFCPHCNQELIYQEP
jgi:DNA-directed RNA polymerase subunit RPC12/RpoP